jgi:hypothetical protein
MAAKRLKNQRFAAIILPRSGVIFARIGIGSVATYSDLGFSIPISSLGALLTGSADTQKFGKPGRHFLRAFMAIVMGLTKPTPIPAHDEGSVDIFRWG